MTTQNINSNDSQHYFRAKTMTEYSKGPLLQFQIENTLNEWITVPYYEDSDILHLADKICRENSVPIECKDGLIVKLSEAVESLGYTLS